MLKLFALAAPLHFAAAQELMRFGCSQLTIDRIDPLVNPGDTPSAPFNKADWPEDGSQPFSWSMGDKTGYGTHGDYLYGWKGDALQKAMDSKFAGDKCAVLQRQANDKCCKMLGRTG